MTEQLTYIKGSLFDAPKGSLIVHACNCRGVWGAGIALEFHKRYPEAFKVYSAYCNIRKPNESRGTFISIKEVDHMIGCLMTSKSYGPHKDSPEQILKATDLAIKELMTCPVTVIYSCKINAGLFGVPWEKTEAIILEHLKANPDVKWIVMTPE